MPSDANVGGWQIHAGGVVAGQRRVLRRRRRIVADIVKVVVLGPGLVGWSLIGTSIEYRARSRAGTTGPAAPGTRPNYDAMFVMTSGQVPEFAIVTTLSRDVP